MMHSRYVLLFLTVFLLGGCAASRGPSGPSADEAVMGSAPKDPLEALLAPAPWPASATQDAPALDLDALAQTTHAYVNAVRAEHDLPALSWAEPLVAIARAHSQDMAINAYFGHTNGAGEDATARAQRAGLPCQQVAGTYLLEGIGENLFLTHRYAEYRAGRDASGQPVYTFTWKEADEIARQAVAGWMQSRTHRANLLSPLYRAEAIGIVLAGNAALFVTQNFTFEPGPRIADASARATPRR
jgi:uncharacterized protein YkwD